MRPSVWLRRRFHNTGSVGVFVCVQGVPMQIRAAVITISDKGSAGLREDLSGPILCQGLEALGAVIVQREMVPDERNQIAALLATLADQGEVDLIVTTGGTGPAPRDWTPEATLDVIERQMPGIAELLRTEGYKKTPRAVLSRGIAGIRGRCLIINLPGSPRAVQDNLDTLRDVLPHAIQMVRGENLEHNHGEHHD